MRRQHVGLSLASVGAGLFLGGILVALVGLSAGAVAASLGLAALVAAGWILARPAPPGAVQAEELYPVPYGPDRDLVNFAEQLRRTASDRSEERQDSP
jgi:hypothetical protein